MHSHHIECVVNYSDGVSEVAETTRNKIQKQTGLSKVWGTVLNQEILELGKTEAMIEQIGKAMKQKIDDNVHALKAAVRRHGNYLIQFRIELDKSQAHLTENQAKLQNIQKQNIDHVGSIIPDCRNELLKSEHMFQKENITAPVFEEKNVENESGSFIDRFGFQSSCEKHPKISKVAFNIGYITRKTISLPGKTKWTDFSKKLNFTPKLVNALGSEIVIVDTNNSIHIFDKKMNSFTNRYYEPMFHGELGPVHQMIHQY